jgi:outer membrane lipoprotein carrier protein
MMGSRANRMQRILVCGWVLCLLQLSLAGVPTDKAGQALRPDTLVTRVQERYDRLQHLRAQFRQETRLQGFDQAQWGEGQVWILKPGMMRWDYTKPERQTIIASGDTLWMYLPADRQAIRDQVNHSLGTRTPALFLAGEAQLTELFTIAGTSPQDPSEPQLLRLELIPKSGVVPYAWVQLGVDPSSYVVKLVRLLDQLGNTTTMWFSDINTEEPVDPALFQFQVPPGVEVMSPPVFSVPQ